MKKTCNKLFIANQVATDKKLEQVVFLFGEK